jgi:type I pantothenate kinase
VMANHEEVIHQPDILIIEGLNVLQVGSGNTEFVSDYFDFSIYIDALESDIEGWFIERFQTLRKTVFQDPNSFFRHFADLTQDQAVELAHEIWAGINGKNLKENIQPTRARASLVIQKGADHKVSAVHLRKL